MRPNDIRIYKNGLRDAIKCERRSMPQDIKAELDRRIARNVLRLYQYRSADTLLVYVSTKIEVDTFEIMANAWRDGKRVAVPRCIPGTRRMGISLYFIDGRPVPGQLRRAGAGGKQPGRHRFFRVPHAAAGFVA